MTEIIQAIIVFPIAFPCQPDMTGGYT